MNLGDEFAELSLCKKHHDDCELILPDDVSQEGLMDFLRKCSAKLDSPKLYKMLSSVIDKFTANDININDFSEMYPLDTDFELKVLELFAAKKANQFSIFLINKGELNPTAPLIDARMWMEITKFKSVNRIVINQHKFMLRNLMEMCKNMPSLNHIKVLIHFGSPLPMDDPNFAQEFSNSFDKIKKFMFVPIGKCCDEDSLLSFSENLTNFGIKHLPNLNRILPIGKNCDMSQGCKEMDKTSQLEYVRLNAIYLEEFATKFDKFPSVRSLVVNWNEWNNNSEDSKINKKKLKLLKKFTKLDDLHLANLASPEHLKVLLNNLGPQLKILDINYDNDRKMKINLKQIQETCPLLSVLEITVAEVEDSQSMASFKSLKKLQIIYDTNSSEKVRLSNLLSPPNLEMVYLRDFQVTRQELQETTSKIKAKAILTKVRRLGLFLNGNVSEEMKFALGKEGKLLVSAVLNMRRQIDKKAVTFEFL